MLNLHVQKQKGGYRLVLASRSNNKLVLAGETLENLADAEEMQEKIVSGKIRVGEVLKASHRFSANAGPKKKAKK